MSNFGKRLIKKYYKWKLPKNLHHMLSLYPEKLRLEDNKKITDATDIDVVSILRRNSTDGVNCNYLGEKTSDNYVSGTYSCSKSGKNVKATEKWYATIK